MQRRFILFFITVLFLIYFIPGSYGQLTKIMGIVVDGETKQPMPFVTVMFKNTTIGTTTDFQGKYTFETKSVSDTLMASYIGYITKKSVIVKGAFQIIDFELIPVKLNLMEVVINPTENPAEILLRKVIKNKEKNDRKKLDFYQYEAYNKVEFDLNNITPEFKNKRIFRHFKFIFDNLDTSTINGKTYLPCFLTESVSDVYYRKEPKSEKEIIKASKASGVNNESVSQFLGDMYQNIDIYSNFIILFNKNFVSPIADFGLFYYKYYLVDSAFRDNKWCYKIMFKPRRKQELTFTGSCWIHDTTFAVKSIDMRIAEDANINFVQDMKLQQEYDYVDNKYWMLSKDKEAMDFNIFNQEVGFYGTKTTTYKKFLINKPREEKFYSTGSPVISLDSSFYRDEKYWARTRHDSLLKDEKFVYKMIDTIKKLPIYRTYVDFIRLVLTGYKESGNIEFGPYFNLYSYNKVEGHRFRLGIRTSNNFSTRFKPEIYLAYGTVDNKFKYGGNLMYVISKKPRRTFGVSYKYDTEVLGLNSDNLFFREDNVIASLFRRNPSDKLSMVKELKAYYSREWVTGISTTPGFTHRIIYPVGSTNLENSKNSITTFEFGLNNRIAFKEKYLEDRFRRVNLGTKYPVFELQYNCGIKNFLNSDYRYNEAIFTISHWFNVGSVGWSKYVIETGKVFGNIPYPLLKIHEGNETYSYNEYAFNMMNLYEFVSNQWISVYYTHHFEGLFLNKIPLLRKLKWREVGYIKSLVGNLSEKYKEKWSLPDNMTELKKPYLEAGTGIENILKILRVDGLWRLSYLDNPNAPRFELKLSIKIDF
ncbi:MAG: DUF5686 family protein [Bacteroidota bacterium]|nr:DUF5686 family protein [Bacteroidota bacterium]